VQQQHAALRPEAVRGGLEHRHQVVQRALEPEHAVAPVLDRVAEEPVARHLLLVDLDLLDAVAQHHVVEALVGRAHDQRVLLHQVEVLLEGALPVLGLVLLLVEGLADQLRQVEIAHGVCLAAAGGSPADPISADPIGASEPRHEPFAPGEAASRLGRGRAGGSLRRCSRGPAACSAPRCLSPPLPARCLCRLRRQPRRVRSTAARRWPRRGAGRDRPAPVRLGRAREGRRLPPGRGRKLGLKMQRHEVMHEKEKKTIRNLYVQIDGEDPQNGPILMFGAHYDTKLAAGHDDAAHNFPFVGAIDGGGAPAVLLELARAIKARAEAEGQRLALLDRRRGVDRLEWNDDRALLGSKAFCKCSTPRRSCRASRRSCCST
jgi:hypothetical protein